MLFTMAGHDYGEGVIEAVRRADAHPSFEAYVTGQTTSDHDFNPLSERDLQNGELRIGLPAALIVLLLVFGAVVAGLMPLMLALVVDRRRARPDALARAGVRAVDLRHEHAHGDGARARDRLRAVRRLALPRGARRAAGRRPTRSAPPARRRTAPSLFSGSAFVLAMIGMLLVPSTIMRSLAVGAILVGDRLGGRRAHAAAGRAGAARRPRRTRCASRSRPADRSSRRTGGPLLGRDRRRASCAGRRSA